MKVLGNLRLAAKYGAYTAAWKGSNIVGNGSIIRLLKNAVDLKGFHKERDGSWSEDVIRRYMFRDLDELATDIGRG